MNNNENIKVSVIIPVYNADLYLEECLSSVINQSLKEIEIICVDDNSKDNSLKILQQFAKKDKRIKVVSSKTTLGQSHARNTALKEAKGEYIGFVDADDFIECSMYQKMYDNIVRTKADIAMCKALLFDDSIKLSKEDDYFSLKCIEENLETKTFNHQQTKNFVTDINVSVWNKLYKRSFLENFKASFIEGFIYEDLPFFYYTYTKASKAVFVNEFLYNYRVNCPNSTMTKTNEKVKDRIDMMAYTYDILQKLSYFKTKKAEFLTWIIHDVFYRFLLIDERYQKEYFFRMQKFFKNLDTSDCEETLLKTPYYPFFSAIKVKNYSEIQKYSFNKDSFFESFINKSNAVFQKEMQALKEKVILVAQKDEELLRQKYDLENEYDAKISEFNEEKERLQNEYEIKVSQCNAEKEKLFNEYETKISEYNAEKEKLKNEMAENADYYRLLLKEQIELQQKNYKIISDKYKKKINNSEHKEFAMHQPKVSIILPVYNVAPYLRQSLDSIICQTLSDIEIICVDDGSTDESGKILDEYKEKDDRIKVIHKKNAGTGAARNDGLKIATGECIGFVDPDDWILPNMYERLYLLLKEKNLDIVMFTPDVFNDQTKKHEGFLYFQNSNFPDFLDNKIFNKDDISPFSYPMCVWNKLYTKKLFDENDISFAEGLDFEDHKVIFKSLFTAKRIYFIREKLYVYRHSRKGSILSDNDTRMFDHIKIYDIVENILKETGNWEKFHLDFLRYKVHNILYYYTMIKPQYKDEYYKKMTKSLRTTKMSEEEINILSKDYPELKKIVSKSFVNKLKNVLNKPIF